MRPPAFQVVRAVLLGLLPVALAAGLWQVERDRPLCHAQRVVSPARPTGRPPTLARLVLAVHYPGTGRPPDRRAAGDTGTMRVSRCPRRDPPSRSPSHDQAGGSTSARPTTPRAGRTTARCADPYPACPGREGAGRLPGVWWGRESEERCLAAASQRRQAGLVLAPYYETGSSGAGARAWRRPGDFLTVTGTSPPGSAFRRPWCFHASHRRPRVWTQCAPGCRGGPATLPRYRRAERTAGARPLLQRFDASTCTRRSCSARRPRRDAPPPATSLRAGSGGRSSPQSPWFDDRQVRTPGTVDRADGVTYDRAGRRPSGDPRDPRLAWNERHEGSEIEPSLRAGRRYLDATRAWAERVRRSGP
jgi:hypothetical protein